MLKLVLIAGLLDGAAWLYEPKIGALLLFILLIANFVLAMTHSVSSS